MSRAKTRGGGSRKGRPRLPTDLPTAAEAALDDMIGNSLDLVEEVETEEPPTQAVSLRPRSTPPFPQRSEHLMEGIPDAIGEPIVETKREITVDATPLVVVDEVEEAASEMSDSAALRIAVFEDSAQLGSVQSAISAAGHHVVVALSGRDGARKVIETLRERTVDAVLVALPGGESIIDAAHAVDGRRPVVIASLDGNPVAATQRAVASNADLVAIRPHDVGSLAPLLFAAARLTIERRVTASARGAEQVLRARLDELADPEPRGFLPFEMFQRVLELELRRAKRFEYQLSLALFSVEVAGPPPPPGIRGILRARAGNALIHTIRDIDIATQLDHERFVVLLPYTDLKGASGLARRVIAAVGAIDPVVAAGRAMSPKLVGAVSAAQAARQVSVSKLMKDAARALEGARKDGADLAVLP